MEELNEIDILHAICIIRVLSGKGTRHDVKILQDHVESLIPDDDVRTVLYTIHGGEEQKDATES